MPVLVETLLASPRRNRQTGFLLPETYLIYSLNKMEVEYLLCPWILILSENTIALFF